MSIRVTLLWILVICASAYAYRDWFKANCALIVLMAVIQHPDMPKNLLETQGLNPWNLLMLNILMGWAMSRRREGLTWDLPLYVQAVIVLFVLVVLAGFFRMYLDPTGLEHRTAGYLIGEYLINTFKWMIPGLLLFDGCRDMSRLRFALFTVLAMYLLLALQVIRWMPPSSAMETGLLSERSYKIIQNEIGYSRVNMSRILAGASWAMVACMPLASTRRGRAMFLFLFLLVAYAQALTGGRMGYVTWCVIGLVLCCIRWRRCLLLVPVVLLTIAVALPGVRDRMLFGFGEVDTSGQTYVDDYRVTAGRSLIWPHVIEKILESPVVGYGRQAMVRTGLTQQLWEEYREAFAHPHNAYMEWMFDNGIIGVFLGMPMYAVVLWLSFRFFLSRDNPWQSAAGGVCLALLLALLVAGAGSQTFYPREAEVGLWASIGLVFRLKVEKDRLAGRARRQPVMMPAGLSYQPVTV